MHYVVRVSDLGGWLIGCLIAVQSCVYKFYFKKSVCPLT